MKQSGFTLIEVLIAVLVLAVGLLGIASLQAMGIKQVHNGYKLTMANYQITSMIERMNSNREETAKAKFGLNTAYDAIDGDEINPGCSASCNAVQRASADAAIWTTQNKTFLDDPDIINTVTNNGDGTYTLSIAWSEMAINGEEDAQDAQSTDNRTGQQVVVRYRPR